MVAMEGNPLMKRQGWTRVAAFMAAIGLCAATSAGPGGVGAFDVDKVLQYWAQPGRYAVIDPPSGSQGPWQVRLTPQGSLWLWALNQKRGFAKPNGVPAPRNDQEREWESWVASKVAYDRWAAGLAANLANTAHAVPPIDIGTEPQLPGPMPESLWLLVGDAPCFALSVKPRRHVVKFHDGHEIAFEDNANMAPRSPYYRFAEGVRHSGAQVKNLPATELDPLFQAAGLAATEQKVLKAVSLLEGGFDAVNTYDTGYVSIGFIQFACLSKGAGSLGSVLLQEKSANPGAFEQDFARFGIDVAPNGDLLALDLGSGKTLQGTDAAVQIIKDKRLAAVFQRAGSLSKPFRIAQLQVAKSHYYPVDETFSVSVAGVQATVKVADVFRSEAGLATLMDRKVNTGRLPPLASYAQEIVDVYELKSASELAQFERDLVARSQFRKNYLEDSTLSQPAVSNRSKPTPSRKGSRGGRGGG